MRRSRSPVSPDRYLTGTLNPQSHEHPLSFSNLPSLSYDDIPIRQLDARNIHTQNEEFQEALILSSPQHPPTTSSTAHKCALKSLGIGIEEDRRNVYIQHSFWLRLLGRSPKSPPKPPIAELVTNATPNETMPRVEDDH
ncbi:hypothetical protein M405DRAFT_870446, partial [Rhizopogon salebrosus TDB-379]